MGEYMTYDQHRHMTAEHLDMPVSSQRNVSHAIPISEYQLIQNLIDSLPHAMWVNTQNNVEYFNRAMTDYLGVNLNQNDSRSWQSFIHPDDLQLFLMQWHDALELYQNVEIQCRIKQPNDDYRMCLLSMKFHNEADAILQWAVSLTDVHDYFEIQQQLSHVVSTQKNMLDASVDCIKIVTPTGELSHMNRSGCEALGVDPETGFGMPWLKLLPPEVR